MLRSGPPRPGTDRPAGHGKADQGLDLLLVLGTHPKAGAIADVRVRPAVNYAIDKVAYRDAIAGRYPATGELASTLLAPGSLGYRPYDLSPTPGGRGDLWERSLQLPAKRLEHQLGQSVWRPDYLGDNARQSIPLQYDSRLTDAGNFSEYHNPAVNRLIDRTLAEPDQVRRANLWAEIDQRIMRDAPLVPLIWENFSFSWASRVHGWVYDPWTVGPDLTAVWLDPPGP
jgi:ABC-type transport system substrate-binding protein